MKADQERVKNLLIDTVTLLCKNSLSYEDELCIEGLLGVKIDQKDVFFVHISQTFQNALPVAAAEQVEQAECGRNAASLGRIRVKREASVEGQGQGHGGSGFSPRRNPSAVGAHRADIVAGQRRSSHFRNNNNNSGASPRGFSSGSPRGGGGSGVDQIEAPVTNNHHHHHQNAQDPDDGLLFGEPPPKRRQARLKDEALDNVDDDGGGGSGLGADCTDDVISPWPNIGAQTAASLGLMATQMNHSALRDFETTSAGDQPGCSSWPFPAGMLPPTTSDMGPAGDGAAGQRCAAGSVGGPLATWLTSGRTTRSHAGSSGRDFPCDVCGKVFHMSHHLRQHVRIHTGERPYRCETCGATFTQISSLNRHQRAQHGASFAKASLGALQVDLAEVSEHILGLEGVDDDDDDKDQGDTAQGFTEDHTGGATGGTQDEHVTAAMSLSPPGSAQYMCTDCNVEFKHYDRFLEHVKELHSHIS